MLIFYSGLLKNKLDLGTESVNPFRTRSDFYILISILNLKFSSKRVHVCLGRLDLVRGDDHQDNNSSDSLHVTLFYLSYSAEITGHRKHARACLMTANN